MRKPYRLIATVIANVSVSMGEATGAIIILMMLLITVEVILRLFGTTTGVTHEYSAYLLVGVVFWGVVDALRQGTHIKVVLVSQRLSLRIRLILEILACLIALIFILILLWATIGLVVGSYRAKATTVSMYEIPVYIIQLVIPIGLFLFAIQMVANLFHEARNLKITWKKSPDGLGSDSPDADPDLTIT